MHYSRKIGVAAVTLMIAGCAKKCPSFDNMKRQPMPLPPIELHDIIGTPPQDNSFYCLDRFQYGNMAFNLETLIERNKLLQEEYNKEK